MGPALLDGSIYGQGVDEPLAEQSGVQREVPQQALKWSRRKNGEAGSALGRKMWHAALLGFPSLYLPPNSGCGIGSHQKGCMALAATAAGKRNANPTALSQRVCHLPRAITSGRAGKKEGMVWD